MLSAIAQRNHHLMDNHYPRIVVYPSRIETILAKGTSADRQLRVYQQALADGESEQDALQKVVDHLIGETHQGWS